jgi:hypothetical protein
MAGQGQVSTATSHEDLQMSLDVYLGNEYRFCFDDNAVYWFLHPWFEQIYKSIGKYIDLYGDAIFDKSSGLLFLIQKMGEAKISAENQPQELRVAVAIDVYEKIHRNTLLEAITKFQSLLEEAKITGKMLDFVGD